MFDFPVTEFSLIPRAAQHQEFEGSGFSLEQTADYHPQHEVRLELTGLKSDLQRLDMQSALKQDTVSTFLWTELLVFSRDCTSPRWSIGR
jgi:hypothetical protein